MRDKVCKGRGANAGVGYEIARALVEQQAHVVLVSGDEFGNCSYCS